MGNITRQLNLQTLLNLHCNQAIHPHDATCCVVPGPFTSIQIGSFIFFGTFVLIAAVLIWVRHGPRTVRGLKIKFRALEPQEVGEDIHGKPMIVQDSRLTKKILTAGDIFYEVSLAMAKLGLIMGYFVLCDRTDFFMKENKYYSNIAFFAPLLCILVLGLFFSETSQQVKVTETTRALLEEAAGIFRRAGCHLSELKERSIEVDTTFCSASSRLTWCDSFSRTLTSMYPLSLTGLHKAHCGAS